MTKNEAAELTAIMYELFPYDKTSNAGIKAQAVHLTLGEYPYRLCEMAVIEFAKNDTRQVNTFPPMGNIVEIIKRMQTEYADKPQPSHYIRMAQYVEKYGNAEDSEWARKELEAYLRGLPEHTRLQLTEGER